MMKMPEVIDCTMEICAYNKGKKCHALAINVGGSGPICEAFIKAAAKCASDEITGGVGACKIKDCQFNECLMCAAPGIHMKSSGSQVICDTFRSR